MARPLQLITCEADGTFTVGDEASKVLRAHKGPVGVVSVCGRARQGKSFILNQIAGTAASGGSGFKVAASHRPCTK
eukprot:553761-Pyramimonas_sp.AAC.1